MLISAEISTLEVNELKKMSHWIEQGGLRGHEDAETFAERLAKASKDGDAFVISCLAHALEFISEKQRATILAGKNAAQLVKLLLHRAVYGEAACDLHDTDSEVNMCASAAHKLITIGGPSAESEAARFAAKWRMRLQEGPAEGSGVTKTDKHSATIAAIPRLPPLLCAVMDVPSAQKDVAEIALVLLRTPAAPTDERAPLGELTNGTTTRTRTRSKTDRSIDFQSSVLATAPPATQRALCAALLAQAKERLGADGAEETTHTNTKDGALKALSAEVEASFLHWEAQLDSLEAEQQAAIEAQLQVEEAINAQSQAQEQALAQAQAQTPKASNGNASGDHICSLETGDVYANVDADANAPEGEEAEEAEEETAARVSCLRARLAQSTRELSHWRAEAAALRREHSVMEAEAAVAALRAQQSEAARAASEAQV
jgi:hypothetical protein